MITFKKIRYKNFLSAGNQFTEIDFLAARTTLITGRNGCGKSSALDAINFGLFGKAYRNINKGQLINSVNQKDCLVEIEFSVNGKEYRVIRGMRPGIFEIYCDGKLIDQDSKSLDYQKSFESQILRFDYRVFNQVVILGSTSYVPFMELSAWMRREVIETILDIRVFSRMHNVLKERAAVLKNHLDSTDSQISLCREKISMQRKHIEQFREKSEKLVQEEESHIEQLKIEIDDSQSQIAQLQEKISETKTKIPPKTSLEDEKKLLIQQEAELEANLRRTKKDETFFSKHDSCPQCHQSVSQEYKQTMLESGRETIRECEDSLTVISKKMNEISNQINQIDAMHRSIEKMQSEISRKQSEIQEKQRAIAKSQKKIDSLRGTTEQDDDLEKQLDQFQSELKTQQEKKRDLLFQQDLQEKAAILLKDSGIKTRIVKQYLPLMNRLVNKHLLAMDFFVNFTLDENFNEKLLSRYRDEFTYASFSEGEKFRINIALLLTWREIAKAKNSLNCNLLFLDEVFDSSLDVNGTEEFMKLLQTLGENTNVFVISHKGEVLQDKFDRTLGVVKEKNFSKIVEIR